MTQKELSDIIAEKIQISVERTNYVLDIILSVLSEELSENGIVHIDEFGVFKTQKRSEYISLNSKTGERLLMPPLVEILFESNLTGSMKEELDDSDNVVQVEDDTDENSEVLLFEPEISLKNRINSAFINFVPTVLNEGVELAGISVISEADLKQDDSIIDEATVAPAVDNVPELPTDSIIVDESDIDVEKPIKITLQEDEKTHFTTKETPPIKQRTNKSRILVPIVGGVAITLAALFFFSGTTKKRNKQKNYFSSQCKYC